MSRKRASSGRSVDLTFADQIQEGPIRYFPVRHHSPACALHVSSMIEAWKPDSVLIEAPGDCSALIPSILDPECKPPFAIYTFDRSSQPTGAYYPFCDYSPEYQAMRSAQKVRANIRFIDLPFSDQRRIESDQKESGEAPRSFSLLEEKHMQRSGYIRELMKQKGCRDQNELWDRLFESGANKQSSSVFIRNLASYCALARAFYDEESLRLDGTLAREEAMSSAILDEQSQGKKRIAVVTGGFHTAGIIDMVRRSISSPIKSTSTSESVLVRFSFQRLDQLNGYDAGMPSPSFYQFYWEALVAGDEAAGMITCLSLLGQLRSELQKQSMSCIPGVADLSAAFQNSIQLARLRGHGIPLREDLVDAIHSTMVRGHMQEEGIFFSAAIKKVFTGDRIGDLSENATASPLVKEFREKAARFRINLSDSLPHTRIVEIYRKERHRAVSRFLHLLCFLDVPFATLISGPDFASGFSENRISEEWQLRWSPMIESTLVECSPKGSTLDEVASSRISEAIKALTEGSDSRKAGAASALLIQLLKIGMHSRAPEVLDLTRTLIAEDESFESLQSALAQLCAIEFAREPLGAKNLPALGTIISMTYQKCCGTIPDLSSIKADQTRSTMDGLVAINELIQVQPSLDTELFFTALQDLAKSRKQSLAICSFGLLYRKGLVSADELIDALVNSFGNPESDGDSGLLGLIYTARELLWQNERLLTAIDELISNYEDEEFVSNLPGLRLAFSALTPREIDRVAESVAERNGAARSSIGNLSLEISEGELNENLQISARLKQDLEVVGLVEWMDAP